MIRHLLTFLLGVVVLLFSLPILAQQDDTIEACFSAYEETQVKLKAKEFERAREIARSCSSGCPREIMEQCHRWAWEAERDAPSVLLVARRENGEDVPGVMATVDGKWKPLQKELLLDPGHHTITFSRNDGWEYSIDVEIYAGEKRRTIRALVPEEKVPGPKLPTTKTRRNAHIPWAVASFSVGAIGLGVAGTFTLIALDRRGSLDTCAPTCGPDDIQPVKDALIVADVGLAVGAAGVATGLGILLWGKPKAQTGSGTIGLSANTHSVSTSLHGRF
jgi:hypothetical protein